MTTTENAVILPNNAPTVFGDDTLHDISSFDAAIAAIEQAGIVVESMADYGNGFAVLDTKDKNRLVGVDFIVLEWRFNESKIADEGFVSASVVTKTGEKLVINDGSTGIFAQLRQVTESRVSKGHDHPQAGLYVKGGLVASNYEYEDVDGTMRPATTYYLSEQPIR